MHAREIKCCLEPPERFHIHIVRERLVWHRTAKNSHWRTADGSAGKNDTMHFVFGYLFGHLDTLFDAYAFPAVIPHIGLDHHCHIFTCVRHDLIEHFVHKPYAVFKTTAVPVMTVVGTTGDELRDKISVTGVYLHAVETALAGPVNRLAEFLDEVLYLRHFEATMDGRAVEVEPCVGTHGHTMTGIEMRHVTAVTKLDARLRALCMNSVRHLLHIRNNLRTDVQLAVERHAAEVHRTIGNGRHTHSAASYAHVVIL